MLMFIGGAIVLGSLGFLLFRRLGLRAPGTGADTMVSAFSTRATTLFGVLLVFTIVSEFNHVDSARETTQREATALAQIVRDSRPFPPAVNTEIRGAVAAYGVAVVHQEWHTLGSTGRPSKVAADAVDVLEQTVYAYQPKGTVATEFYHQAASALTNLVSARRDRLEAALPAIPSDLLLLLLGGSVVFILTMLAFSVTNERLLVVLIVGISALTGAGMLVAVLFDYPFSGSAAVSTSEYHQGALQTLIPN